MKSIAMRTILVVLAAVAAGAIVAGPASATTVIPFQIAPAPFGNPNGSFDVPPIRCGVEVGRTKGVARVVGTRRDGWGCLPYMWIRWLNVTNGRSGAAKMSSGLDGVPAAATMQTGVGQVVLSFDAWAPVSPGYAAVWVP